jgi:FkbM family methyltransferase
VRNGSGRRDRVVTRGLVALAHLFRPMGLRGYSRTSHLIARSLTSCPDVSVLINPDTRFVFPLDDVYWVRLMAHGYAYEPEIRALLHRIGPFALLDGGANYGYWSALVTSSEFGAQAVEASGATFERLRVTAMANGDRFSCVHAAIAARSGESVQMHGAEHAARSTVTREEPQGESVNTVTIDDLVAEHAELQQRLVIKLDVEGAEIEALEGARETLKADPLVIYEDHGRDRESLVTAVLLEQLGWEVGLLTASGPERIRSVEELTARKTDRRHGYNCVAFRPGSSWGSLLG